MFYREGNWDFERLRTHDIPQLLSWSLHGAYILTGQDRQLLHNMKYQMAIDVKELKRGMGSEAFLVFTGLSLNVRHVYWGASVFELRFSQGICLVSSGISGSYGSSIFSFFKEPPYHSPQWLYQSTFQQRKRVPFSPHPLQNLGNGLVDTGKRGGMNGRLGLTYVYHNA